MENRSDIKETIILKENNKGNWKYQKAVKYNILKMSNKYGLIQGLES